MAEYEKVISGINYKFLNPISQIMVYNGYAYTTSLILYARRRRPPNLCRRRYSRPAGCNFASVPYTARIRIAAPLLFPSRLPAVRFAGSGHISRRMRVLPAVFALCSGGNYRPDEARENRHIVPVRHPLSKNIRYPSIWCFSTSMS